MSGPPRGYPLCWNWKLDRFEGRYGGDGHMSPSPISGAGTGPRRWGTGGPPAPRLPAPRFGRPADGPNPRLRTPTMCSALVQKWGRHWWGYFWGHSHVGVEPVRGSTGGLPTTLGRCMGTLSRGKNNTSNIFDVNTHKISDFFRLMFNFWGTKNGGIQGNTRLQCIEMDGHREMSTEVKQE